MRFGLLIVVIGIFVCIGADSAFACGEGVQTLIKSDGWEIPKIDDMQQIKFKNLPAGAPADLKAYAPKQKTHREFLIVSKQSSDPPGVLQYSSRQYKIEAVVRYQASGKTFAYQIFFKPDEPLGCTLAAVLSDQDGDGKFETYQAFSEAMPTVPKWAARE